MPDQNAKGIGVITRAAQDALRDRGVKNAAVTCVRQGGGDKPGALLTIAADDSVETQIFSYEEIEDSGEAIDAPAALKVRMLVSKFVR